jgi:hypothetical protein
MKDNIQSGLAGFEASGCCGGFYKKPDFAKKQTGY